VAETSDVLHRAAESGKLSLSLHQDKVTNLQVLWDDGERVFCRGWRANEGGRSAVLAVLPAAERPPQAILDRLAHEYELRDELDASWAARPLALARESGRTALLLEDPGGEPLVRLIDGPMEVERFLGLAIGIAATLGKAHQRGLVHKDIKPANILVDCADGRTRLTGFGIASRLPRERQTPEPPAERLETIPAVISEIAMKLLAKTAEDRYQTAVGLEGDLRSLTCRMGAQRAHRAVKIVSNEGFAFRSRSSDATFKFGRFVRSKQTTFELPAAAVAARREFTDETKTGFNNPLALGTSLNQSWKCALVRSGMTRKSRCCSSKKSQRSSAEEPIHDTFDQFVSNDRIG
jgi:hypothetical protein